MLPNHCPIISSQPPGRFLAMLGLAIGCALAFGGGPARAGDHGDRDHDRGHWEHGHRGHRHWDHGRWVYGAPYGVVVAPAPVYAAPPPVYVAPAPVYAAPPVFYPPSVSLGVTIR
jgi:hypothetical protein